MTLGAVPGRNNFNPNAALCFESKSSELAHTAISRQIRKASNQKMFIEQNDAKCYIRGSVSPQKLLKQLKKCSKLPLLLVLFLGVSTAFFLLKVLL